MVRSPWLVGVVFVKHKYTALLENAAPMCVCAPETPRAGGADRIVKYVHGPAVHLPLKSTLVLAIANFTVLPRVQVTKRP